MKKRRWTAAAVAVMLLFTGCSFGTLKEQKTGEIEYEIVKKEEIPEKLKEEIAEAEKSEMWISYADTGNEGRYLYIVKGYGRQETTGYSIEVNEFMRRNIQWLYVQHFSGHRRKKRRIRKRHIHILS